ncbi:MobF family relaxase [Streptomyces sp. NPDC002133]|uniref:MobF family relaxase n=1 Tax=Streptomyces sp. NPDC002133 TaxID=3154409 RepID=UPI0033224DAB
MAGDGWRPAGKPLHAAQEEVGVPPGRWMGRGLAALGLVTDDIVTERQAELLLGEGRHPDADRIERELQEAGKDPAAARRATVLGRPIEHIASPLLALDLVFRPPPTAHAAWALADDETRRVLELCHQIARNKSLTWTEESVAQVRWGSGGRHRAPIRDGLVIAAFRHYESRTGQPLLHDHALVSIKVRRPDGQWGNLSADSIFDHVVAAGTLYTLTFMEEVSERLGVAWEPREVTPGKRPVMEIAGIDHRLIDWQSTRRQQILDALPGIVAQYENRHGHAPGERAAYALARQAADDTRPPKPPASSLSELRARWRASAIRAVGTDVVDQLMERARAAAAAVRDRVQSAVDVALAAVDTVAVVYVMRGAFQHRHLLAEARRHIGYVLRGRRHEPGLDEQIVQAAIDGYTSPVRRALTADFRSLYPHEPDGQAEVRPLTQRPTASRYERARLASDALTARIRAARRSRRLATRSLPHAVSLAAGTVSPQQDRQARGEARVARMIAKARHERQQQTTDIATADSTLRFIEAAAKLRDGVKERTVAYGPPTRPASPKPAQQSTSQSAPDQRTTPRRPA